MKVFVSSTYKDLIEYRNAAIRAVEGTSFRAIKMEVFGARPDEPLSACVDEVFQSDLFIGIYAFRYGFIPEGSDISITEIEYVRAKQLGKPIYCFLLDEENQPWLKRWIEGEPGKSKLEDFKKRVQKDHVCAFFTSPEDLGMKVANALSHYIANSYLGYAEAEGSSSRKSKGSTLPHQSYFFGQEKELAIIADAISPESRTWGVLIEGPGGIGKTSLAIEAAYRAPKEDFDYKLFVSAKTRELTPSGEKLITDFIHQSYLEMVNEVALQLDEDRIPKLAPEERTKELWITLRGKRSLIVYDNIENLHESDRTHLFQLLSRLPEGNKAIVTSRRRADVDAPIVRVDRLSSDEALQLMGELAKNNNRLAREDKKARQDLYEITSGHPLLIKWVCGQLGRDGSPMHTIAEACEFIVRVPQSNNPLEYIFGDLLRTCTENEIKVLATITHFTEPAKPNWISDITMLSEGTTQAVLKDLCDRSILIIDGESDGVFLLPLSTQFIRSNCGGAINATSEVLATNAFTLVMRFGGVTNYEGFKALDVEWPMIRASLPYLVKEGTSRLQSTCTYLYQFFSFTGRWDEAIELNKQAEQKALDRGDLHSAGQRVQQAAFFYSLRNQGTEVLALASRAEAHWKNSGPYEKSLAFRMRGLGHLLEKNYLAAINAHKDALELRRSINPESIDVAISLDDLAEVELAQGNFSTAEQNCREALHIFKKNDYLEGVANETGNLASLALDQEQWEQAEILAREALAVDEEIGRIELIAIDCLRLAKALTKRNRPQEAFSHASRAVEIYTRLNSDLLSEARNMMVEIEQKIKDPQNNKYISATRNKL